MDRKEALALLRSGPEGIRRFNHTRPETLPDLSKANLSETRLFNVNLSEADLRGAKIRRAELYRADLRGADLRGADLRGSKLSVANLRRARLDQSDLRSTILRWADLRGAVLGGSKLDGADLTGANLIWTDLFGTRLNETILYKADLRWSRFGDTSVSCGLSHTKGLNETKHWGPSYLSPRTLLEFKGEVPVAFLRGCGLANCEIEKVRSRGSELTQDEFEQMQADRPHQSKDQSPFMGGIFIAYAHEDADFVQKLEKPLLEAGIPVWCDEHKDNDDPMRREAIELARPFDVALLILSHHMVHSDWVNTTITRGLEREQQLQPSLALLKPIALDDTWKTKVDHSNGDILWNQFSESQIFDFSQWQEEQAFDTIVQELLCRLKIGPQANASD